MDANGEINRASFIVTDEIGLTGYSGRYRLGLPGLGFLVDLGAIGTSSSWWYNCCDGIPKSTGEVKHGDCNHTG